MFAAVIKNFFHSSGIGCSATAALRGSLCFDSSPSVGEKTAVVHVFVAISRIEMQAPRGLTGVVNLPEWGGAEHHRDQLSSTH